MATSFTTHSAGQVIASADINLIQTAVNALENATAPASGSGQLLASGMANMNRESATTTDRPASGSMIMSGFIATKSFTAANVNVYVTGAGSGLTLLKVGLFSLDASGNGTRIAVTADQSADANTNTGKRTYAFTGSVAVTAGTSYAVAILGVGTTRPSYAAATFTNSAIALGAQPFRAGVIGSLADIGTSFVIGTVGATATFHLVEVTT